MRFWLPLPLATLCRAPGATMSGTGREILGPLVFESVAPPGTSARSVARAAKQWSGAVNSHAWHQFAPRSLQLALKTWLDADNLWHTESRLLLLLPEQRAALQALADCRADVPIRELDFNRVDFGRQLAPHEYDGWATWATR